MNKGFINRILPFSSVDGPGNRTAIFLQGCNFNCLYCHNPETINICNHCGKCLEVCKMDALSIVEGKVKWAKDNCNHCHRCIKLCKYNSSPRVFEASVEEIMAVLKKNKVFISGITVSGGECTLQIPFLVELFKEVKKLDLTIFVDTNGSIPLWNEGEFVTLADQFMVDLKSIDAQEHKSLTGSDFNIIVDNIKYLSKLNKLHEVRTVIVPNLLNNRRNVEETSLLVASLNPLIKYKLIKYRGLGVREGLINDSSPTEEDMNKLEKIAKDNGCEDVQII